MRATLVSWTRHYAAAQPTAFLKMLSGPSYEKSRGEVVGAEGIEPPTNAV